ncbi:MAG: nicotinate-nucleotide adenylyltransferase [Candidatus Aminicenantes bacterium]
MVKDRIGIFGGTFNPIHQGHVKAARMVHKKFCLRKILFIPSYIPPHKQSAEVASPFHRLRMVELAAAPYSEFVPSSIEIEEKGKSYSIVTLKKIKSQFPSSEIFFILGVDAFLEIDTWKDYQEVLDQCFFVVISRPGYRLEEAKRVLGGRYRERMHQVSGLEDVEEKMLSLYKIFLFAVDSLDISSTEIRQRARRGDPIKGLVPEPVDSYIYKNKLYQQNND